ncbi:MAG TPA: TonB family protein [Candidatus Lustribacter sp.]
MIERTYITTGERVRNYLAAAFALSLLLNALLTAWYPNLTRERDDTPPPDVVTITHRTHVRLPTPPPPTPKPRVREHRPAPAHPLVVTLPRTRAVARHAPPDVRVAVPVNGLPTGDPHAPVGGVAAPVALEPATAAPACAHPNADASVTAVVPPDYPDSVRDLGLGPVSVLVAVTIGSDGALLRATIAQSSNNFALDQSALRSARESTYAPRIADCVPAVGTYLFHADFDPN